MYKKALSCLVMIYLLFLFGFLCIKGVEGNRNAVAAFRLAAPEAVIADEKSSTLGILGIAASGQRVVDCDVLEKKLAYNFSEEELEVLLRIVEAEAGTEDEEGKLLVANMVLNRMNHEKFPDTVSGVVFQRENGVTQFSPVANGRFWRVKISEETVEAVGRAIEGEDISEGALYFAARKYADSDKMKWFDEKLTFLFKHGGHEFFK